VLRDLRERRSSAVFPTKADDVPDPTCERDADRERTGGERRINHLTPWRRIAAGYAKRVANDLAMPTCTVILR
jgi:hypothetical protein